MPLFESCSFEIKISGRGMCSGKIPCVVSGSVLQNHIHVRAGWRGYLNSHFRHCRSEVGGGGWGQERGIRVNF